MESLVHQISWPPLSLKEEPLALGHVMVISRDYDAVEQSRKALKMRATSFTTYVSVNDLCKGSDSSSSEENNTAIMLYLPETINSLQDVAEAGSGFCSELLTIVKHAAVLVVRTAFRVSRARIVRKRQNAFLDTLASHRRGQGDNCMAIQWTSWRGMGMAASTDFINAELESKGITDISKEEAFRAWEHLVKYDMDHGVILRTRVLDQNEPLPAAILSEIATRQYAKDGGGGDEGKGHGVVEVPKSGPALVKHLDLAFRTCVAQTLHMASPDDVDLRAALSDLGVDSVTAVLLRTQLQKSLGVKMPPTLLWWLPTASHLQEWFVEQMEEK